MKNFFNRFGFLFFFAIIGTFMFSSQRVFAEENKSYDWVIDKFESEILINKDSTIEVSEKITVNFFQEKHGIYRNIPYRYYDQIGTSRNTFLNFISVSANGADSDYEISYSGGNATVKIGDPNYLISGKQVYEIKYNLVNALNYFDQDAELYFNVNGNDWDVPIREVAVSIYLPENQRVKDSKFLLGRYGDSIDSRITIVDNHPLRVIAADLNVGEGLTFVARWDEAITPKPSIITAAKWWISANIIFLFPVLSLIILMFLLYKFGVDPKGRGALVVEFEPPKELTLLEIGILVDEKADNRDFSALFISLATNGFIKIIESDKKNFLKSKEYKFIKNKDYQGSDNQQKKIMEEIFKNQDSITMSSLASEGRLFSIKGLIEKDAFSNLVKNGYFSRSPQVIKGVYYFIGFFFVILAFFMPGVLDRYFTYSAVMMSMAVSAVLFFIFAKYMPQRSKKGVLIREKIDGFKHYLKIAEKHRMHFFENEYYFEKYLPYAITLGVSEVWAKKFEKIYKKSPEWYEGKATNFSVYHFSAVSLNNQFSSSLKSAFCTAPASSSKSGFSSGGGFSGGGFGGGGGGSW